MQACHDHSAGHFRKTIQTFLDVAPDGWPCWSFSNHDVQRHVSRWTKPGGDTDALARQSIALLASFPGTLNLYQGEELGQLETDITRAELQDTANIAFWPEYKGRDGCRTPMTWDNTLPNAGFSTGTPWLPVKAPQAAHALNTQTGNASVLASYRAALGFRKQTKALRLGGTSFLELPEPLLGIVRSTGTDQVTGLFNLSDAPQILTLTGQAALTGPQNGALTGTKVSLPPHGYVFLASTGAVKLTLN